MATKQNKKTSGSKGSKSHAKKKSSGTKKSTAKKKTTRKTKEKSADLKVEVKSIRKKSDKDLPKEKVVYVEVDEEVTAIIDRLKHIKNKSVVLVTPKRSVLLQSVINLKLLKVQMKKQGKEIAIITSDKKGRTLASQVGLTVYSDLKSRGVKTEEDEEEVLGKKVPVKAKITKQEEKPVLKGEKMSLKDLLRGKSNSFSAKIGRDKNSKAYKTPASPNGKEKMDASSFVVSSPSRRLLGIFLGASVFALLAIMVFILPNAVLYVRPEIKIEKPLVRVVLADEGSYEAELKIKTDNVIASKSIQTDIEMTRTYSATGKTANGVDAQGYITVHNEAGNNQPLVKTTRFRADNGVIFRTQEDIVVPAGGTTQVYVVADTLDENGEVAGEKANIEATTRLSVPGLTGENKDKIYGINEETFTNGTTEPVSIVTEADIEAAKSDIQEQLVNSVRSKLVERIEAENAAKGTNMALLASDSALKTKILEVRVMEGVQANQVLGDFKVYAKAQVSGVTYDKNEIIEILNRELNKVLHPDMHLDETDFESLALQYVGEEEGGKRIKVNASMAYKLEYTLDDDLKAKVIEQVLGKGLREAEEYIQSLEEVSEAQISTWPFWVRKIPGIASNIRVEKLED